MKPFPISSERVCLLSDSVRYVMALNPGAVNEDDASGSVVVAVVFGTSAGLTPDEICEWVKTVHQMLYTDRLVS